MAENTVWMIGDKRSRKFLNFEKVRFDDKITFASFYPCQDDIQREFNSIIGRHHTERYVIIEAEVLRFDGTELIVAYDEDFREISPI